MTSPVLYSTNPLMKLLIQERMRHDSHYVWCSESYDARAIAAYTASSLVGPTSNPKELYYELDAIVKRTDLHSPKITKWAAELSALAVTWETNGEITAGEKDDIIYMVSEPKFFAQWKPLLYIIPRAGVASRLIPVPAHKCASLGPEFIIQDLKRSEFDVIEL